MVQVVQLVYRGRFKFFQLQQGCRKEEECLCGVGSFVKFRLKKAFQPELKFLEYICAYEQACITDY